MHRRAFMDGLFTVTLAGARALAETRAIRDRLWAGVELAAIVRGA